MNIPAGVAEGLGIATQLLSLAVPEVGPVIALISAIQSARIAGRPDLTDADLDPLRDRIKANQKSIDDADDLAQAGTANASKTAS